ncbi:hypothetical protein [Staphylothermus hellenicus]|uniref:hypothetical protein n=1 Tax=Staphylothermus hellenicus TaxID=84599 RepID=UPI0011E559DC|nr:hypothetical protein [Staphylothermus hellenicus]
MIQEVAYFLFFSEILLIEGSLIPYIGKWAESNAILFCLFYIILSFIFIIVFLNKFGKDILKGFGFNESGSLIIIIIIALYAITMPVGGVLLAFLHIAYGNSPRSLSLFT